METLKYTVIKNIQQYDNYCIILEQIVMQNKKQNDDEIDLLTLLIENWDRENNSTKDLDPVELLKELMDENNIYAKDLVNILNLSKGTISKILNYQTGLSKESIRTLSNYFKISQEAFNRHYSLTNIDQIKNKKLSKKYINMKTTHPQRGCLINRILDTNGQTRASDLPYKSRI